MKQNANKEIVTFAWKKKYTQWSDKKSTILILL